MAQGGDTVSTFSFRKLGSDSDGGANKSSLPGDGNAGENSGFISPEIARATAGGASASGSEPAESTGGGGEPARRGRGRPKGSGTKSAASPAQAKQESSLNVNGIEKILYSLHAMGASLFAIPEMEITEDEARRISKAIAGVSDQYKVMIDPRRAAQIDLVRELGTIYGSRAVAYYLRKKAEKARPVNAAPQRAPQPQRAPAPPPPQPAMQPRETQPQRPPPPQGVDDTINDPLANIVTSPKPNGSVPVVSGDDAPMSADAFGFDPRNIKVMN